MTTKMLGEITDEIKDAWDTAMSLAHLPTCFEGQLALAFIDQLARALKVEFELRCFRFNFAPSDNPNHYDEMEKHSWTDADWLAEAERLLRG